MNEEWSRRTTRRTFETSKLEFKQHKHTNLQNLWKVHCYHERTIEVQKSNSSRSKLGSGIWDLFHVISDKVRDKVRGFLKSSNLFSHIISKTSSDFLHNNAQQAILNILENVMITRAQIKNSYAKLYFAQKSSQLTLCCISCPCRFHVRKRRQRRHCKVTPSRMSSIPTMV